MYDAVQSVSRATSCLTEIHVVDLEQEAAGMMSVIFEQLSEGDLARQALGTTEEQANTSHQRGDFYV